MGSRRPRLLPIAVVTTAASLALSACSGSDSESPESSSPAVGSTTSATTSQPPAADYDKAAAAEVLLVDSDLPGYAAVPDEQLAVELGKVTGPIEQAAAFVTVEPAVCDAGFKTQLASASDLADVAEQSAIRLFVKAPTSSLTEAILPATAAPDLAVTQQYIEQCQQMTLSVAGASGTATVTPVPVDLGDEAVGSITTLELSVAGQKQTIVSGNALVKDGEVAIGLVTMDSAGVTGDEAVTVLTDAVTKAHAKAAPILD